MRGVLVDCGPCPYLPDRRFHAFQPESNPPEIPYRELMDLRFRRSGPYLYTPMCPGCRACQPIRIDIATFSPRKDQRRCRDRNRDLRITWHQRGFDPERGGLYTRYQAQVHGREEEPDGGANLLEDGGVQGGELHARDEHGRLLAVSVVDRFADALSSVYCYFDPDQPRRSLGTFMVLAEIEHCRFLGLRWLYLGFLVKDSAKMAYKARFLPHEILDDDGWRPVTSPTG